MFLSCTTYLLIVNLMNQMSNLFSGLRKVWMNQTTFSFFHSMSYLPTFSLSTRKKFNFTDFINSQPPQKDSHIPSTPPILLTAHPQPFPPTCWATNAYNSFSNKNVSHFPSQNKSPNPYKKEEEKSSKDVNKFVIHLVIVVSLMVFLVMVDPPLAEDPSRDKDGENNDSNDIYKAHGEHFMRMIPPLVLSQLCFSQ